MFVFPYKKPGCGMVLVTDGSMQLLVFLAASYPIYVCLVLGLRFKA